MNVTDRQTDRPRYEEMCMNRQNRFALLAYTVSQKTSQFVIFHIFAKY